VLGLINGKANLIHPTSCIGDGACKKACPINNIVLVIGTEKQGVEIPVVKSNFETNVPDIFIAGELGGMGLISNAIEQGRLAIESIVQKLGNFPENENIYDVIIVGSGPAGFSATLAAKDKGLNYLTIEQEALGGTVAHYPKGKIIMTSPAILPIIGKTKFTEITKEELLQFWKEAEKQSDININYGEHVNKIVRHDSVLKIITQNNLYETKTLLLAIGRRGTPRKLNIPGEEKSKVVYQLTDPEQYENQKVLVVGGGNSALEAALAISEIPGTTVTLSYRKNNFGRAKKKNRELVQLAKQNKRLNLFLNSNVKEIGDSIVVLEQDGKILTLKNDSVIICAGGILPTGFLRDIGIECKTLHGEPVNV